MQFVEKGAGVEADVLASLTAVLPPELRDAMPEELRSALGRSGAPAASAPTAYDPPAVDFAPVPAATVAANQIGDWPLSVLIVRLPSYCEWMFPASVRTHCICGTFEMCSLGLFGAAHAHYQGRVHVLACRERGVTGRRGWRGVADYKCAVP